MFIRQLNYLLIESRGCRSLLNFIECEEDSLRRQLVAVISIIRTKKLQDNMNTSGVVRHIFPGRVPQMARTLMERACQSSIRKILLVSRQEDLVKEAPHLGKYSTGQLTASVYVLMT